MEVGLKTGQQEGFYAFYQEFGTSKGIPGLGLLQNIAKNNLAQIIEIESKYLSYLENEAKALRVIDEKEMDGDGDEED